MSLIKSITNGREHRRPYHKKPQIVSKGCRCHGGCEYCYGNRMHKNRRSDEAMSQSVLEADMSRISMSVKLGGTI